MRIVVLAAALLLPLPGAAAAQSADSAAVMAVVTGLFDAMRERDTTKLRATFAPDARLLTVGIRAGQPFVGVEKVDGFAAALAQPSPAAWDEKIYKPEVRIDGNLATVWVEYDFYLGDKFSHCGVDAFQLARYADGWKVVSLADTRQREGCPTRS